MTDGVGQCAGEEPFQHEIASNLSTIEMALHDRGRLSPAQESALRYWLPEAICFLRGLPRPDHNLSPVERLGVSLGQALPKRKYPPVFAPYVVVAHGERNPQQMVGVERPEPGIFPPLKVAMAACDPEAANATSAVCVWVTPTERHLGFVECVAPADRMDIAKMLLSLAASVLGAAA